MEHSVGRIKITAALAVAALAFVAALPPAGAAAPPSPPVTPPGLGRLVENNTSGEISGAFVSLLAPRADDIIEDYASGGVLLFDRVAVEGYALQVKTLMGSIVEIRGLGAFAEAHDTPSSLLKLVLDSNTTAVFHLSAGASAAWGDDGAIEITVGASNRSATLWTTCAPGTTSLDAGTGTITVSTGQSCAALVRSHVLDPAAEGLITAAAESRHLGAEVSVAARSGEGSDVSTYGDTTVIVTHAEGRVVVSVESAGDAPTSVLVRFVPPDAPGATQVTIDGRPAKLADSLEDALDATDDGETVEYLVSSSDSNGVLVVSIPSPGSHVIEIQSVAAEPLRDTTSPLLGAAVALACVAAAAFALFRRR